MKMTRQHPDICNFPVMRPNPRLHGISFQNSSSTGQQLNQIKEHANPDLVNTLCALQSPIEQAGPNQAPRGAEIHVWV